MVPSKNEIIKLLYELFFPDDPQVSVMLHVTFHNWFSIWALTQPDFSENDFSSKFYVPEPLYLLKAMIFFCRKTNSYFLQVFILFLLVAHMDSELITRGGMLFCRQVGQLK